MHKILPHRYASLLAFYGLAHFAIDFACALTVISLPALRTMSDSSYFVLVITYNLAAFGSQPLWGWLSDRWGNYPGAIVSGLLITGLGTAAVVLQPALGVLLLGCGNAIFHVAAGAVVYNAAPGRADGPGIFVAPGGVGLMVGIMIGLRGGIPFVWLTVLLSLTAFFIWQYRIQPAVSLTVKTEQNNDGRRWLPILMLFLLVVAIRSFTGFTVPIPWKASASGPYLLALAAFAGKTLGGILADRFGWKAVSCIMLLVAAVAGFWHRDSLLLACVALFCIQTTTGVTLAGTQSLFPGRPAFAFGLPCVAIVAGGFLFFTDYPVRMIHNGIVLSLLGITGSLAAYWALTRYTLKET